MKKSAHVVLFENLQFEMAKRHLSHTDIAHRTGLSVSAVKQITAAAEGDQTVNLDKLDRLAGAFDLSAAQLLSPREPADTESDRRATTLAAALGTRRAARATPKQLCKLIEDFFTLPEVDRIALVQTATDMASKYRTHITS